MGRSAGRKSGIFSGKWHKKVAAGRAVLSLGPAGNGFVPFAILSIRTNADGIEQQCQLAVSFVR
jgi:hypothetical protein